MTVSRLKYGNPLALQALFASAGEPMQVKSLRDVGKLIYRQFPPYTWAILSGVVIGIAIMLSIVAG